MRNRWIIENWLIFIIFSQEQQKLIYSIQSSQRILNSWKSIKQRKCRTGKSGKQHVKTCKWESTQEAQKSSSSSSSGEFPAHQQFSASFAFLAETVCKYAIFEMQNFERVQVTIENGPKKVNHLVNVEMSRSFFNELNRGKSRMQISFGLLGASKK